MVKVSILIATLPERKEQFDKLVSFLLIQAEHYRIADEVEILSLIDNREWPIGVKRQKLLDAAQGDFVAFIDDDDTVSEDYLYFIWAAATQGCFDSIGFLQQCTFDGGRMAYACLSNQFEDWHDNIPGQRYQYARMPYHKTPMRREIAHAIGFGKERYGEDYDFSKRLKASGLIKDELFINRVLYYYRYSSAVPHEQKYGLDQPERSITFYPKSLCLSHKKDMTVLKTIHNAGFFSCCTIRLQDIVNYVQQHGAWPDEVDSSKQFEWYKTDPNEDLSMRFFDKDSGFILPPGIPFEFSTDESELQFSDYSKLNFFASDRFVHKYFTPGVNIHEIERDGNYCAVLYRGNDKNSETQIASYEEFINQCRQIKEQEPDIKFFVLPDETEFLEAMEAAFPGDVILPEGGQHIRRNTNTCIPLQTPREKRYEQAVNFYAAILTASLCGYLVTHSGNCGLWAVLYRGHTNNVRQYLNGEWL